MDPMSFTGALLKKTQRMPGTTSYRFSRPAGYDFVAGQFYTITIPSPEGPLTHAFSHCDSPTEDFVELTTRLTGSDFKNALDALPLGAEAQFFGPLGSFVFRYDAPKIAFLTGGIGITPIRSMLRYLADTGGAGRVEGQELVLFYGCMTEDGVVYGDELDELAQTIPGLRVVLVITNPAEDWKGYRGFISADVIRAELPDASTWTYYIVGPPPMVVAMQKILAELEVPDSQTVVENFAGYAS
jgi:glycine betaine catabolism B